MKVMTDFRFFVTANPTCLYGACHVFQGVFLLRSVTQSKGPGSRAQVPWARPQGPMGPKTSMGPYGGLRAHWADDPHMEPHEPVSASFIKLRQTQTNGTQTCRFLANPQYSREAFGRPTRKAANRSSAGNPKNIPGTWYQVPRTRYLGHSTRCLVHGTR